MTVDGTLNRRAFDDDWHAMYRTHPDTPLGGFSDFDCDHFKAINDTTDTRLRSGASGCLNRCRAR